MAGDSSGSVGTTKGFSSGLLGGGMDLVMGLLPMLEDKMKSFCIRCFWFHGGSLWVEVEKLPSGHHVAIVLYIHARLMEAVIRLSNVFLSCKTC